MASAAEMTVVETVPTIPLTPSAPPSLLERAVMSGAPMEMIERLITMQERVEANNARKAFDSAIAAAKAEIPVIKKSREVDFVGRTGVRTHYFHEDMAEIAETVDPILAKHGLSYRFQPFVKEGGAWLRCIIAHRDGYREESEAPAPVDDSGNKNRHQAQKSGYTFTQRTMLMLALGLAAGKDDDGKAAGAGGTITDAQAEDIAKRLSACKADVAAFLKYVGAESVSDIPASRYDAAIKAVEVKERIVQKTEAANG